MKSYEKQFGKNRMKSYEYNLEQNHLIKSYE